MIQGQPTLRAGMRVAEVGNLQRFLNELGHTDWQGKPLVVDEDLGPRTVFALQCWQRRSGGRVTGELDAPSRITAERQGFIPFLQARNYTPIHPKTRFIRTLVLHTMEAPEARIDTAENVAAWFADRHAPRYPAPRASAHFCVDCDSIVQCVREQDIAWHAPGVNHDGIGIELAGTAWQTAVQWQDSISKAILHNAAKLCALLCRRHQIPVVKLSPEDMRRPSAKGFSGHVDATNAFSGGKGNQDPGPRFPWDSFLGQVRGMLGTS